MKKIAVLIFSLACFAACGKELKSFTPGEIWPDDNGVHINAHGGGLLFHDGTYYWFGEHKVEGDAGNRAMVGVHCYSSKDLYNWKDEGVALAVAPEGSGGDIEKSCILERPKVIYNEKTGKFVMWFHLELVGEEYRSARTGVAVADSATGPYKFVRSLRPNAGQRPINWEESKKKGSTDIFERDFEGGQFSRDMALFVDDDGKAYHIHSSEENKTTHISELTDDYLDFSGKFARVFPDRYMEAPAVFKRGGWYYFIGSGCTGWDPNAARSARTQDIMGEWEELGNPCVGEGADITFGAQSTYALKVEGMDDAYILLADRWRPKNAIDGRYVWLPIDFEDGKPVVRWHDEWDLSYFDKK